MGDAAKYTIMGIAALTGCIHKHRFMVEPMIEGVEPPDEVNSALLTAWDDRPLSALVETLQDISEFSSISTESYEHYAVIQVTDIDHPWRVPEPVVAKSLAMLEYARKEGLPICELKIHQTDGQINRIERFGDGCQTICHGETFVGWPKLRVSGALDWRVRIRTRNIEPQLMVFPRRQNISIHRWYYNARPVHLFDDEVSSWERGDFVGLCTDPFGVNYLYHYETTSALPLKSKWLACGFESSKRTPQQ